MTEKKWAPLVEKTVIGLLLFGAILLLKYPTLHLPFYWDEVAHIVPLSKHLMDNNFYPILHVPEGDRSRENFFGLIQDPGHPPLVFLLVAFAFQLFGIKPVVGHLLNCLFSWAAVYFLYLMGRRLYGTGQGLSAALILLTSPLFFAISGTIHLTMATTALTVVSIYLAITKRKAAFAVICSMMMLTRGNAFLAYPGMLIYALYSHWDGRLKSTLKNTIFYLVPAAVYAAWMIFHYLETGYVLIQPQNYFNVLPHQQLSTFFWGIVRVTYIFFFLRGGYFLSLLILVFLVLYLRKNLWTPERKGRMLGFLKGELNAHKEIVLYVLIPLSYMGAFCILQNLSARYLLPTNPILVIMGTACLFYIFRKKKPAAWVIVILLLAFNVYCWRGDDPLLKAVVAVKADVQDRNRPDFVSYENNLEYVDVIKIHREAAAFLEENFPDKKIVAGWPLVMELAYPYLGYVEKSLNMDYIYYYMDESHPEPFDVLVYASESNGQSEFRKIFETTDLTLVRRFSKGSKRVSIFVRGKNAESRESVKRSAG